MTPPRPDPEATVRAVRAMGFVASVRETGSQFRAPEARQRGRSSQPGKRPPDLGSTEQSGG